MTLTLGWGTGELDLQLNPSADFTAYIELRVDGVPADWPAGTAAWLRISARGTSFDVMWPATVAGAGMSWSVPAALVGQVPRGSWAELWLDYPDAAPLPWLEGRVGSGCGRSGFGPIVAVPGMGGGAVAVPVPGPPGPPGDAATARVLLAGTAAVTLSGHRAVYRRPDGLIDYVSCTNPAHLPVPVWVTTAAAAAGTAVSMLAFGELTESSWSWAPGPIFLGEDGGLVQALPSSAVFLAVLATATAAATVFVDRQPSIHLT